MKIYIQVWQKKSLYLKPIIAVDVMIGFLPIEQKGPNEETNDLPLQTQVCNFGNSSSAWPSVCKLGV